ncbi:transformation system protein [Campylobacter sp.]|uniref:transformation system protein n=1 Tax=Campylobacter sp. TaxID=205 RepID=UPI002710268F|nr:transformation system protein [Campylobacter sp.]
MLEVQEILELEKKWKAYDKKRVTPASAAEKKYYNYMLIALLAASVSTASLVFFYLQEPNMKVASVPNSQPIKQSVQTIQPTPNSVKNLNLDTNLNNDLGKEELPNGTLLNKNYSPNFANNENGFKVEQQENLEILADNENEQNQQGWIYLNDNLQANLENRSEDQTEINDLRRQVLFTAPNEEFINLENDGLKIQNNLLSTENSDNSFKIQIQSSGSEISVDELKSKFDRTNSSELATLIAKKYYDIQDYKSSEKWAVIANELNSENEESWVIFAKSKYNLGQKYDAVRVLRIYNDKANSKEIETLIKHIENNSI